MKKKIFMFVLAATFVFSSIITTNSNDANAMTREEEVLYSGNVRESIKEPTASSSSKGTGGRSTVSINLQESDNKNNGGNSNGGNSTNNNRLPKTGGSSTTIYTIIGTTIAGMGILLLLRKDKERNQVI